jgi:lysophospholipase L1-like esterase
MKTEERPPIEEEGPRVRRTGPDGRRLQPAGEALIAMLVALILWTFIEAPRLKEAAQVAPFGARRTASLVVLTPMAAVSEAVGLGPLTRTLERALGRDEGGLAAPAPPEPLPTIHGPTTEPRGEVPGAFRDPTPANKLRVVVIGDSLAVGLARTIGAGMEPALVRVVNQARLSTGLARPDAFDWPAEVARIGKQFRPDLVVILVGTNDTQPISYPDGRVVPMATIEWVRAYRAEIDELITSATSSGARVAWVGLPTMQEPSRRQWARRLNAHYRTQVKMHAGSIFVDTWDRFTRPDGSYAAYTRDDRGRVVQVREADGLHFTYTGYTMVADLVFERLREVWDLPRDTLT